jgi:hypothetical protein
MAIRRPNKPAEEFEPEELFAIDKPTSSRVLPAWISGFPVDFALWSASLGTEWVSTRLTSGKILKTSSSEAEVADSKSQFDFPDGHGDDTTSSSMSWMWRRAPGFFDVVTYEGDGQGSRERYHSLNVEPEMIWVKSRSISAEWPVYHKDVVLDGRLDSHQPFEGGYIDSVSETTFTTLWGVNPTNKAGEDYIAYLWASVPGICDIGTYTGNGVGPWSSPGDSLKVDCGFTNGARFVLVKRTDAPANWIFFDTIRGSQSTLSLNTTNAEVLAQYGTDAPWPLYPKGFAVVDYNFDADLYNPNIKGATYIYMAIA